MNPQERKDKIEKYGNAYNVLVEFLKGLSEEEMAFKPAPDKWSAYEIIVHITDSEANSYCRLRKTLAEPGGTVIGYDQDTWAVALNYTSLDSNDYLDLFRLLRKTCYDLIKNMPEEKWQNQYNHTEYGLVNLEKWLDIYSFHVEGHINQINRNIEAMKSVQV